MAKCDECGDEFATERGASIHAVQMHEDPPWHDKETLVNLYIEQEQSMQEIGDELGTAPDTISYWLDKFDIESRTNSESHRVASDIPEVTEEQLYEMYHERGLSQSEIAEETGYGSQPPISGLMAEFGIEARSTSEATSRANRKKPAGFGVDTQGYEVWRTRVDGVLKHVYVHRLVAVAEFGYDAVTGEEVHHQNHIKWDNRPSNLRPMSPSEHRSLHHAQFSDFEKLRIKELYRGGECTYPELGKIFDAAPGVIGYAVRDPITAAESPEVVTDGGTGRPDDCRCEEFDETVCPPCSMAGFDTRADVESMSAVRSERANTGGGESGGVEEL